MIQLKDQLAESFEMIRTLNGCCGNGREGFLHEKTFEILKNQALRVLEEIKEVIEAIDNKDRKEILKEASDVIVTVDGLTLLVDKLIGEIGAATLEVCKNNDLKYTGDREVAEEWLEHHNSNYNPDQIKETYYISESEFEGGVWYCVKRESDHKFVKPPRHPKVDLSRFLWRSV